MSVFCPFCGSGNTTEIDFDLEPESKEWQFNCGDCEYMWEQP